MTRDNDFFDTQSHPTDLDRAFIEESRRSVRAILKGEDPRLLLLVGPCSVHDLDATIEYGERLAALAENVSDRFFCVMRCYVEKPRTTLGWKGLLYDPHLDGSYAMDTGLQKTRELLSRLTAMRLPLGSEVLELTTSPFYTDFLSWGCIGARTSSSPPHRQTASGLPFPIGFKNSVDGNVNVAINGMIAAREEHIFLGPTADGRLVRTHTQGNPDCHIILRGSEKRPNYYPDDVAIATRKAQIASVNDRLVIDCSHDNSCKEHTRQPEVFDAVIRQIEAGCSQIAGLMLESFLEEGTQPIGGNLKYGVSVTDPCLSWEMTEQLILSAYRTLMPSSVNFCFC